MILMGDEGNASQKITAKYMLVDYSQLGNSKLSWLMDKKASETDSLWFQTAFYSVKQGMGLNTLINDD